mmetsp:Transcript_114544/g.356727  ORF Transcript_114544/g.356727 Transcript_114544/m.356727 type:complete len:386 (-) Transcript_114544:115-1272(-)
MLLRDVPPNMSAHRERSRSRSRSCRLLPALQGPASDAPAHGDGSRSRSRSCRLLPALQGPASDVPAHQEKSRSRSRSCRLRAALRARADKALAAAKLRAAAAQSCCVSAPADAAGPGGGWWPTGGAQTLPLIPSDVSEPRQAAISSDGSPPWRGWEPQQAVQPRTSAGRAAAQAELPAAAQRCVGVFEGVSRGFVGDPSVTDAQGEVPCRFFGSMRGCTLGDECSFSHQEPNSVEPCGFLLHAGCLKAACCSYRHAHWASVSQAKAYYADRRIGAVLEAERAWHELHGDGPRQSHAATKGTNGTTLRADAPVFVPLAERYGAPTMKMMRKMGFELGRGMGRREQGRTEPIPSGSAPLHGNRALGVGFGVHDAEDGLRAWPRGGKA